MIISGGVAELGGAFLSLVAPNHYREGRTGGRGLFGYTDALQSRQGGTSVHALFGSLAMALAVFAAWLLQAQAVPGAGVARRGGRHPGPLLHDGLRGTAK